MVITEAMRNGVVAGVGLALVQSLVVTATLKWALKKKFFFWIWFGGIFSRVIVLILTAIVVSRSTQFNVAATLLSLVVSTTVFLIIEAQMLITE